jgi:hypothetical protein
MQQADPQCEFCDGAMHPIKLIDKAHYSAHTELEYALADASRSIWTGRYPLQGKVIAYMCDLCGHIAMYGRPKVAEASKAGAADVSAAEPLPKTTKCFSCGEPIPETADRCAACGWSKR